MENLQPDLELAVQQEQPLIQAILAEMETVVFGQRYVLERIVLGILANGHILIEGVPGLAKTLAIKTFAATIQAKFQRIQFTPDMLPSDLTGTLVYHQQTGSFTMHKGPIFTNLLLADEINRASAKVQSALLEVMEERQVTIGETSFVLEEPFMVLATQNPIEHEGTYSLPESQLDRFLLKVRISYPPRQEERRILKDMALTQRNIDVKKIMEPAQILKMRQLVDRIHVSDRIDEYILNLIEATRSCEKYKITDLKGLVEYGASPRASLNLSLAAKVHAFLAARAYVTPEDIKAVAKDVLAHRIILSYRAEAEGVKKDEVVQKILDQLAVP